MLYVFPKVKMKLSDVRKVGDTLQAMETLFEMPSIHTAIVDTCGATVITMPALEIKKLFTVIQEYKAKPYIQFINNLAIFNNFDRQEKCKLFLLISLMDVKYTDYVCYEGTLAREMKIVIKGNFDNIRKQTIQNSTSNNK